MSNLEEKEDDNCSKVKCGKLYEKNDEIIEKIEDINDEIREKLIIVQNNPSGKVEKQIERKKETLEQLKTNLGRIEETIHNCCHE